MQQGFQLLYVFEPARPRRLQLSDLIISFTPILRFYIPRARILEHLALRNEQAQMGQMEYKRTHRANHPC